MYIAFRFVSVILLFCMGESYAYDISVEKVEAGREVILKIDNEVVIVDSILSDFSAQDLGEFYTCDFNDDGLKDFAYLYPNAEFNMPTYSYRVYFAKNGLKKFDLVLTGESYRFDLSNDDACIINTKVNLTDVPLLFDIEKISYPKKIKFNEARWVELDIEDNALKSYLLSLDKLYKKYEVMEIDFINKGMIKGIIKHHAESARVSITK